MFRIKHKQEGRDLLEDVFGWDVQTWSKALELWEPHVAGKPELRCLEVGANKGGLSLWLAMHDHHVVCSDLQNPKQNCIETHAQYQVSHLIEYQSFNAKEEPVDGFYDIIIFKSILGGIGRDGRNDLQVQTIKNLQDHLRSGGKLLFAENLQGSWLHKLARKTFVKWGRSWRYLHVDEVEELLADFENVEWKTTGWAAAFVRKGWLKNIAVWKDRIIFNWLMSSRSKYVVYGVAQKK